MGSGDFDRPITIERRGVVRNSLGEEVEGWSPLKGPVWARLVPASGGESFGADQRVAEQRATFEIRYRRGITPHEHRVRWDGRIYEIEDVAEPQRREVLVLTTHVLDAGSGPEEE